MQYGIVYITGQIGSFDGQKGVELIDFMVQFQNALKSNPERILVVIDSPGGLCDVGHDLFTFLSTQKIPVDTHVVGMCASIATLPLLAGENRFASPDAEILVHNPWISNVSGDFESLQDASEYIRKEEDKLIDIYTKKVGISKEGIDVLLKQDTFMSAEQALSIGFITAIKAPDFNFTKTQNRKAMAVLTTKNEVSTSKAIEEGFNKLIDKFNTLFKGKSKGMMVQDDQGRGLELWNPDQTEATEIKQGLLVTMDGAPAPDGTYNLPAQSVSISVSGGTVSEVTPIQSSGENMKKENEDLKKENSELKAKVKAMEDESKKTNEAIVEFRKQVSDMQELIKATHEPDDKNPNSALNTKPKDKKEHDLEAFRAARGIKKK